MKKSLLMSAGMLLAAVSLSAAHVSTNVPSVPAYMMPGAEVKMAELRSLTALDKAWAVKPVVPRYNKDTDKVQMVRIAGTALDATPKDIITKDTLLVTSVDYIENGNVETQTTIEYDKYGRRTMAVSPGYTLRYTYTVDDKTRWLSRTVETKYGDDDWLITGKEERTISGDRVTSITSYTRSLDGNGNSVFYKVRFLELEYRDEFNVSIDSHRLKDAAVTHAINYMPDGRIRNEYRYEWMPLAGQYVMTYMFAQTGESERVKEEAVIVDDHVITTRYYLDTNMGNDYVKNGESIVYYGSKQGRVEIGYDGDGNATDPICDVREGYVSENGDSTCITYDYVNNSLVPFEKSVYTADYLGEYDYTRDFNRESWSYGYASGEWVLNNHYAYKHHLLPNGLSEITQVYGTSVYNDTVKAQKRVDEYGNVVWDLLPVELNDDGSYMTAWSSMNGEYIYTYYAADGSVQKEIYQKYSDIDGELVFFIKKAGDTDWSVLSEYSVTESSGSVTLRTVYKTTADGKPQSITEYITTSSLNGGKEFKSLETIYTYKANGDYKIETYEVYTPTDITKMAIMESAERVMLSDGTIQITKFSYNDNGSGKIDTGSRTENKDGFIKTYSYNTKTGQWTFEHSYCETVTYITEDGVTVEISKRVSDDGQSAINATKSEFKMLMDDNGNRTYEMNAFYEWDESTGKWVGKSKTVSGDCYFTFEMYNASGFDPINAYDDEYMVTVPYEFYNGYERHYPWFCSYEWDAAKEDWAFSIGTHEEYSYDLNGDTLTLVRKRIDEYGDGQRSVNTLTTKTVRDSQKRVIVYETITDMWRYLPGGDEHHALYHTINYSAYNEVVGLLSEKKTVELDETGKEILSSTTRYNYTNFTIETSEVESIVEKDGVTLTIHGNAVSAPGETIRIYSVSGMQVSVSEDSAVLPAVPGVYVVKAGNITRKVAVK